LAELAKATGHTSSRDMMIDAAAFTIAMRDANIDKEFSGRLFEFLDEGARSVRLLQLTVMICPSAAGLVFKTAALVRHVRAMQVSSSWASCGLEQPANPVRCAYT
jgi:hypothetical protein